MDGIINVELTAGVGGLVSGLNQGQAATQRFYREANAATTGLDRSFALLSTNIQQNIGVRAVRSINTASSQITRDLARAGASAAAMGQGVRVGSNQAAFALTNLGRVAQDAPFGFIGIQNNLNPLLESFQRLRVESGSNAAALRALGQSLVGPAGIGVALSLITAALTFAQMGFRAWTGSVKSAKEEAKEFVDTLEDVQKAQFKGIDSAQKELISLRSLYSVATNTNISLKQRKDAVDALQRQYPAYFKNLSDESILVGKAQQQYYDLSNQILATARARAAEGIIAKNSTRQLENDEKLLELRKNLAAAANQQVLAEKRLEQSKSNVGDRETAGIRGEAAAAPLRFIQLQKEIQKEINGLLTDTNLLEERNLRLREEVTKQVIKGADLADLPAEKDKREKKIKTLSEVLKELQLDLIKTDVQLGDTFSQRDTKKVDAYQKAINELIDLGYKPESAAIQELIKQQVRFNQLRDSGAYQEKKPDLGPLGGSLIGKAGQGIKNLAVRLPEDYKAILTATAKFNADFNSLISDGFLSTVSGIGESIGEALATGGNLIEALGSSILDAFGGFLSEFGDLLIKYGAAAVLKGKLDLAVAVPGAGIFAGAAAIAAGIALKVAAGAINGFSSGNKSDSTPKRTAFANGGVVSGPTNALIGEYAGASNNPEVVAPLDKLNGMIAKSIRSALATGLGAMNSYAGSGRSMPNGGNIRAMGGDLQPIVFIAENKIEGEAIVTVYRRTSERLGRT